MYKQMTKLIKWVMYKKLNANWTYNNQLVTKSLYRTMTDSYRKSIHWLFITEYTDEYTDYLYNLWVKWTQQEIHNTMTDEWFIHMN